MNDIKKQALVTGGAGFIGSNLVDGLIQEGYRVKILDDLSTGRIENLDHVMHEVEFTQGDIQDVDVVEKMVKGNDVVFHQAAVVSVPLTVKYPVMSSLVNDIGTLNVLEAARKTKVERVVLASSCAVYGDDPRLPKKEAMAAKPQTPYAVQKYTNELNAAIYTALYGLETVCLRYFNVFGPRQDPSSPYSGVISIFMSKAQQGQPPVIYGDGTQYRDFIFVKDVVSANLLAAKKENIGHATINIGTGSSVTVNTLWSVIASLSQCRAEPRYEQPRTGDIFGSCAHIDKAKKLLGFEPCTTFEDGLKATHAWYRQNG